MRCCEKQEHHCTLALTNTKYRQDQSQLLQVSTLECFLLEAFDNSLDHIHAHVVHGLLWYFVPRDTKERVSSLRAGTKGHRNLRGNSLDTDHLGRRWSEDIVVEPHIGLHIFIVGKSRAPQEDVAQLFRLGFWVQGAEQSTIFLPQTFLPRRFHPFDKLAGYHDVPVRMAGSECVH
jgi:hypothetical protein